MGGKKQTQSQTQNQQFSNTNTYGWQTPPDTADVAAMRNFQFQADPRVGYSFARTRRNLSDSYGPMGANVSPTIRDAQLRASYEDIGQEEAQALREENYGRQALDYARTADVAAMTQPRMVQERSSGTSSGSGSGTVTQTQSPLGSIIQGGSAIGSALIM